MLTSVFCVLAVNRGGIFFRTMPVIASDTEYMFAERSFRVLALQQSSSKPRLATRCFYLAGGSLEPHRY